MCIKEIPTDESKAKHKSEIHKLHETVEMAKQKIKHNNIKDKVLYRDNIHRTISRSNYLEYFADGDSCLRVTTHHSRQS